jgi:ubiquinone/menaquinone biosynthesis C-methylase UbiE
MQGVTSRMGVLDMGSAGGDAAFLAAGLAGPSGEIVGTDSSPVAVARAGSRARERSLTNVTFCEGDPAALSCEQGFDTIVGRYVLMFNPNPASRLKGIAGHLKPGGVTVFHEVDWGAMRSFPPSPTLDQCCQWIVQSFHKLGTNTTVGLSLRSVFIDGGLPRTHHGLAGADGRWHR